MNQNDIRRILNHVFMNFCCPQCDSELHEGDVNITFKTALGIMFSIDCPECDAKINVNGFLPEKTRKKSIKAKTDYKKFSQAIEKIKTFNGENIADLFHE